MRPIFLTFLIFLNSSKIFGQTELRQELEKIIATKNVTIGISIKNIEDKDTLNINGTLNAPLMSVFKFHIALATLIWLTKEILH
jgi:beta-lactamase class A